MEAYQDELVAYLKGEMENGERQAFEEALTRSAPLRAELERSREVLDLLQAAGEQSVVERVRRQIERALERRASDIHLTPTRDESLVCARIDGRLEELERIPREEHAAVVDRWKMLGGCELAERHLPQHGRFSVRREDGERDVRVTFMPTVLGERVTAMILSAPASASIPLARLGLFPEPFAVVQRLASRPWGFVGVAGPVRSGRTTTLYSMIVEMLGPERPRANIMTVEDPVEHVIDGISQTAVNRRIGLTFAEALRAIHRSDEDVVLVGALPDRETADLALKMAVTGHLVLAPLNARSALDTIPRLREQGVDPFMIARTLAGTIGQRLVRRICGECAAAYDPSALDLRRLGLTPSDGPFTRGSGCESCRGSGYRGRIGLFEVLEADDPLRQLIAGDAPLEVLWRETFARAGGSLWDDAREKVRRGMTTAEEVGRALFDYPRGQETASRAPGPGD